MSVPAYPTPARSHTGSFRVPREELGSGASRTQLSAMWAAARARNALSRRWHFTSVSAAALVLSLVTITLLPRQAARLASLAAPRPGEKIDTLALAADAAAARQAFVSADSALQTKRDAALRAHSAAVAAVQARRAAEALAAGGAARRDSLSSAAADLDRLIARAQTSPLPTSYRALADLSGLRDNPRVRAMIDSLDDVEREREAFGVVSGVDPVYVQLTNAINRYGRVIEGIADQERTALRDQLAALGDPAAGAAAGAAAGGAATPVPGVVPAAPTVPAADTARPVVPALVIDTAADAAAIQQARLRSDSAQAKLAAARVRNLAVDRRVETARARANVEAPPSAMLVSAFALALVIGFAIMLGAEIRRPRVADAREAERVSRTRVLAVVRPEASISDRARRAADEEVGGLIDSSIESYRMLYLSLAATGAAIPVVAVTGDDPAIAATVAANVAAVAAEDGRSTLVVDADMGRGLLSTALGVRSRTGLSDIARSNLPLAEAIVPVTVGRGLTIDVVPAGVAPPPPAVAATANAAGPVVGNFDTLRLDLGRLTRRYDFAVLGMPPGEAEADARGFRIAPDVVVCARAGHTPLAGLALEVERLQQAGARVRGLVLWDDERPSLDEV